MGRPPHNRNKEQEKPVEATGDFNANTGDITASTLRGLADHILKMPVQDFRNATQGLSINIPTKTLKADIGWTSYNFITRVEGAKEIGNNTSVPIDVLLDYRFTKNGNFNTPNVRNFFQSLDPNATNVREGVNALMGALKIKPAALKKPAPKVEFTDASSQPKKPKSPPKTPQNPQDNDVSNQDKGTVKKNSINTHNTSASGETDNTRTPGNQGPALNKETKSAIAQGQALWAVATRDDVPINKIAKRFGIDAKSFIQSVIPNPDDIKNGSGIKIKVDLNAKTDSTQIMMMMLSGDASQGITIGKNVRDRIAGHILGVMQEPSGLQYVTKAARAHIQNSATEEELASMLKAQGLPPQKIEEFKSREGGLRPIVLNSITVEALKNSPELQLSIANAAAPMVLGKMIDSMVKLMSSFGIDIKSYLEPFMQASAQHNDSQITAGQPQQQLVPASGN